MFAHTAVGRRMGRPVVRRSLEAALAAITARCPGSAALHPPRLLLRRRSSAVFLVETPVAGAPCGVVIKVPLNNWRAATWPVHEETQRLRLLADRGPRDGSFYTITALAESEQPPFVALPYFPSVTLRDLLRASIHSDRAAERARNASFTAGRWLGRFNAQTRIVHGNPEADAAYWHDRVEELRQHAPLDDAVLDRVAHLCDEMIRKHAKGTPAPRYCHGDFTVDNILVNERGTICVIDPERLLDQPFADFCQFRNYLALFAQRRGGDAARQRWDAAAECFSRGFASACGHVDAAAFAYFAHVVATAAWYFKQGRLVVRYSPHGLLEWWDRAKLMRHWCQWLRDVPAEPDQLWPYLARRV